MAANPGADEARSVRLAALGVLLLALLPSVGTLDSPWIAEDSAILARVRADGPWADWTRTQYGLLLLRFWRPLVSTSWALQEAWTGIAPVPLRLFNLGLHALVALLVFGCARRLGAGLLGAFVAGGWIALFPEQGGTSTWLAGRTDLLCAAPLLASVYLALAEKPLPSALCAFLACAAKEFGFLAPLWIALFSSARGEARREAARRAAPALVAAGVALVWRRLAIGTLVGGYSTPLPGLVDGLAGASLAVLSSAWPSLLAVPILAVALGRGTERWGMAKGLCAWALALAPLYPLLADGLLESENRRLLYAAECALALAAGLAWGRARRGRLALPALAVLFLGARAFLAWSDTHEWAHSARMGEQEVARARMALAGAPPGSDPVLFSSFPVSVSGAYCLGYGVAARFRAPFPEAPRPVWPWRLAFVQGSEREREPLVARRSDGSIWPLEDARTVSELRVVDRASAPVTRIELDERVLGGGEDRSPPLGIVGGPAGARLEVVLASEIGYEPVPLGALDASGGFALSARGLLAQTNGVVSIGEFLMQAADLGARRAFAELRALGPGGDVLAASRWIEVSWPPELLAQSLVGGR